MINEHGKKLSKPACELDYGVIKTCLDFKNFLRCVQQDI